MSSDEEAGAAAPELRQPSPQLPRLLEKLQAPVRDGRCSPPPADWEWRPRLYMGDSARAGSNAFKQVFEDHEDLANTEIKVIMCSVHVGTIWCNRTDNKALLRYPDNLAKIKRDLAQLNTSMWIPRMVLLAQELMYDKWWHTYKEKEFTDAFVKAWDGME